MVDLRSGRRIPSAPAPACKPPAALHRGAALRHPGGPMALPGDDWVACPRCRTALARVVRGGIPRPTCPRCGFIFFANPGVGAAAAREAREEAGMEVVIGEPVQVTSNFHEPEKPTVGIWFAATLADPAARPVAGDDAVAVGWFDPTAPPPLAFPTDAALLARLARRA